MKDGLTEKVMFPESGRYVVAVSGGVDSMSLLHILKGCNEYELIVAHVDHGLREESEADRQLVQKVSERYDLKVKTAYLHLRENSESSARRARYDFLHSVYEEAGADGIITAHHLDDRVETMLLNKRRGAGWFGLSPLRDTPVIKRPLLGVTKRELTQYAHSHDLAWREDPTNRDADHTPRNRIRQQLNDRRRRELYEELGAYDERRDARERYITNVVDAIAVSLEDRVSINRLHLLEYDVPTTRDALYMTLKTRFEQYMEIDFDAVMRLEHFYKTAATGKKLSLSNRVWARMETDDMVIFVAS